MAEAESAVMDQHASGAHREAAAPPVERPSPDVPAVELWLLNLAEIADRILEATRRLENILATTGRGPDAWAEAITQDVSPSVFRHEGEFWTVSYRGRTVRVRDLKGMACVAHLLGRPRQEVHVTDLALLGRGSGPGAPSRGFAGRLGDHGLHVDTGSGDAQLDPEAKAAYRQRLVELEDELEEALRNCDPVKAARAQAERDVLVSELAKAVGLGGRDRRAASVAERTRVNVTRTIRAAIDRIEVAHGPLGRHLSVSIRTGNFCCYDPEPPPGPTWET